MVVRFASFLLAFDGLGQLLQSLGVAGAGDLGPEHGDQAVGVEQLPRQGLSLRWGRRRRGNDGRGRPHVSRRREGLAGDSWHGKAKQKGDQEGVEVPDAHGGGASNEG